MKKIYINQNRNVFFLFFLLLYIISINVVEAKESTSKEAFYALVKRVLPQQSISVNLNYIQSNNPTYSYNVNKNGCLCIEATDNIAASKALYDYLKSIDAGVFVWSGNNLKVPKLLLPTTKKVEVISPFLHHYYMNATVFGYTTVHWDWKRWEQEIDWMALHGIDMPLALNAYEAIIARVWRKMGLSKEHINVYFTGPSHLPWMRMGNISFHDGPLNEEWHQRQIDLQHKILKRMRSLGMHPICPGFAGFVPPSLQKIYPKAKIVETSWNGKFHNYILSLDDSLYAKMSQLFIETWEEEFEPCNYYLIDSFNELEAPFPSYDSGKRDKIVARYGKNVYEALKAANPNAIWTMQGWMFGFQRHIWDERTLQALLSEVPNDKMLILDLAANYNKYVWNLSQNWHYFNGFSNKSWVYSVIPNMGGKNTLTGDLSYYANNHLKLLRDKQKGNLIGFGFAPEGLESNEVVYELLSDAGWSSQKIDCEKWLDKYTKNRYHCSAKVLNRYWDLMQKTVYKTYISHPRYNWQFRPGTTLHGSVNLTENYFKAFEAFIGVANQLKDSKLYCQDVAENMSLFLAGKVEQLVVAIMHCLNEGEMNKAKQFERDFAYLMTQMDRLLVSHPYMRLEKWLERAKNSTSEKRIQKQYVQNAKRIVTVWGPPVDDYSARIWSGLIRDYYLPRWRYFFKSMHENKNVNMQKWELKWVNDTSSLSAVEPIKDIIHESNEILRYVHRLDGQLLPYVKHNNILGSWTVDDNNLKWCIYNLPLEKMHKISYFDIVLSTLSSEIEIEEVILKTDNSIPIHLKDKITLKTINKASSYQLKLKRPLQANNHAELIVKIKRKVNKKVAGRVKMNLK